MYLSVLFQLDRDHFFVNTKNEMKLCPCVMLCFVINILWNEFLSDFVWLTGNNRLQQLFGCYKLLFN